MLAKTDYKQVIGSKIAEREELHRKQNESSQGDLKRKLLMENHETIVR